MTTEKIRWHVLADTRQLAQAAAQTILNAAHAAISKRQVFNIVLAGGHTPKAVYQMLVNADTNWSKWRLYFGDERCLPPNHADRNSVMVAHSWTDKIAMPTANIYAIPAELGPEQAAAAYVPLIKNSMPFDMVLLGMGEDGHTASLFPGHTHNAEELVHAIHGAPKPPAERVSLSFSALNNCREALVLVSGREKQAAVKQWRDGAVLPISAIHGQTGINVYLDELADGRSES